MTGKQTTQRMVNRFNDSDAGSCGTLNTAIGTLHVQGH